MTDLYLFDIDGTLVDMDDIHLDSYEDSYREVVGNVPPRDLIHSTFGLLEEQQHVVIFEKMDYSQDDNKIEKLIEVYYSIFNERLGSLDLQPLPGVVDFLEELKSHRQYRAILTAHTEQNGRNILKASGLERYFILFGFMDVDKHEGRADIAHDVIKQARHKGYDWNRVLFVGDSGSDVNAGKEIGALTVGVSTSYTSAEKLLEDGADLVLESLVEYPKIFDMLSEQ